MALIFIDNYDSFSATIIAYLKKISTEEIIIFQNDKIDLKKINPNDKIIISPGPNIPNASGELLFFIEKYKHQNPMLGICLGHQAIAQSFGAELKNFASPSHGKKETITIVNHDVLFQNIKPKIQVGLYHSWYVNDKNFPKELIVTSINQEKIIMSFRHQSLPVFGVQFHPESYMTEFGMQLLKNFISIK